ncbi:hypothetical protein ACH0CM_12490 [Streptomyces albus]|uniref:hypothetical protein n=1 Tax=Streptomyces albus TaxID=1888 RepID=UPI003879946C
MTEKQPAPCGHWDASQRRYCGATRSVRRYRNGYRCPHHPGPPLPPQTASSDGGGEYPHSSNPETERWRRAAVRDYKDATPCVLCGQPAMLRDPDTGRPMHKVCAEQQTTPARREAA